MTSPLPLANALRGSAKPSSRSLTSTQRPQSLHGRRQTAGTDRPRQARSGPNDRPTYAPSNHPSRRDSGTPLLLYSEFWDCQEAIAELSAQLNPGLPPRNPQRPLASRVSQSGGGVAALHKGIHRWIKRLLRTFLCPQTEWCRIESAARLRPRLSSGSFGLSAGSSSSVARLMRNHLFRRGKEKACPRMNHTNRIGTEEATEGRLFVRMRRIDRSMHPSVSGCIQNRGNRSVVVCHCRRGSGRLVGAFPPESTAHRAVAHAVLPKGATVPRMHPRSLDSFSPSYTSQLLSDTLTPWQVRN